MPARADELDPSLNDVYHRPGPGRTYREMRRFGIEFSDEHKQSAWAGGRLGRVSLPIRCRARPSWSDHRIHVLADAVLVIAIATIQHSRGDDSLRPVCARVGAV
jgi:hypothetical protein